MKKYRALRMVTYQPPGIAPATFDVGEEFGLSNMKGPTGLKQSIIKEWLEIAAIEEVI